MKPFEDKSKRRNDKYGKRKNCREKFQSGKKWAN